MTTSETTSETYLSFSHGAVAAMLLDQNNGQCIELYRQNNSFCFMESVWLQVT